MLSAYPACFIKEDNGYSVIFPDLNDLATCVNTLDEALAMAVDCLAAYAKTHFEKSVKKTLTIPAWPNTAALEQNINFSQVLQEALMTKLHLQ